MSALIAGYARTPFVRFNGAFAQVPAAALGAHAARAALSRAGIRAEEVEHVFAGQVLQAGAGQNPARQAAHGAGVPLTVPAITLNAVCLSGLLAVAEGARLIESGEADVVLAIGQESMSLAPHAWSGSRAGRKYGAIEFLDLLENDALTDAFEHRSMGASTQQYATEAGLGREEQDAFAAASHRRAAAAREFFAGEIEPFEVAARGGAVRHAADDGVRDDTSPEVLAKLRPAFGADGTITAGSSSQITDGAAAIVLVSERRATALTSAAAGAPTALARVVSSAFVAGPGLSLLPQPANAIEAALAKTARTTADLAAVEINEAFAAVALQSTAMLGVDPAIVNAEGGAIALGHPVGASGTRIVGHLARRLQGLGAGTVGAAGICGGGGQGAAVILEGV